MTIRMLKTSRTLETEMKAIACDGPCGVHAAVPEAGPIMPFGWVVMSSDTATLHVCVQCQALPVQTLLLGTPPAGEDSKAPELPSTKQADRRG